MQRSADGESLREFVVLTRHFSTRLRRDFFGTGEGDTSSSLATALSLLLAYGICVAVFLILSFGFQLLRATDSARVEAVLSAHDVLTASTLALTGAYFVFLWEQLFPDRFDCHVLLVQPISSLMVLGAKLFSVLGFLLLFVAVMHSACLIVVPLTAMSSGGGFVTLQLPAYVISIGMAMLTAFFGLAGLVALLVLLLPYRVFLWVKPAMQFGVFVVFLGQMFFSPPLEQLRVPATMELSVFARYWPSFWFTGLADWIADGFLPHGAALAQSAFLATGSAILIGVIGILLAYPKVNRIAVEETDFCRRGMPKFRVADLWLRPWLSDDPPALAIGLFILKVLLRDARSRAMFLLYAGLASAYALREVSGFLASSDGAEMSAPYVYLLPLPLVLVVFAMMAVRALCATPISMQASWIFRLVDWGDGRRIRKALRGVIGAVVIFPAAVFCLVFHAWVWNSWLSCTHTVFLVLTSLIAMEWILRNVEIVPFTQPKAEHLGRLRVMFGIYVLAFVALTFLSAHVEYSLLGSPLAFVCFLLAGTAVWLILHVTNQRRQAPGGIEIGQLESFVLGLKLDS